jgi:hypothetical protein
MTVPARFVFHRKIAFFAPIRRTGGAPAWRRIPALGFGSLAAGG